MAPENEDFNLPDLGIENKDPATVVKNTTSDVTETLNGNKKIDEEEISEFNKTEIVSNCLEKGINIIKNGKKNPNIDRTIDELSTEHSLRGLRDIFRYRTTGGVYILANKQQTDQAREDISMILDVKRSIYMEYNPVKETPNLIKLNNFSTEKIGELYNSILKQFIEIKKVDGEKPIESIINELYELSTKIETYKLHKKKPELEISESLKEVESILDDFEKIGDMNFVFNLVNPLYSVSANNDKKIDIEMKISAIVKNFENTPFTLVITQVDIPQDETMGIKPHTWGAEIKDFTLDLPTKEKYKEEIISIFNNIRNTELKDGFLETIAENPDFLDDISKVVAGLYLPNLKEHITKYSLNNSVFDSKNFENSFYKYKFEILKDVKSGALEIVEEDFDFSDIGGSEGLKNDFANLARQILKESKNDIKGALKKTYMLTGIPGSGKSLIAKAIKKEFEKITGKKWIEVRLNISKLFDKFVGQTEKNFSEIVKILDSLIDSMDGRIILWIDELEKSLGGNSDHSTTEKLKGEILTALEDKWGKKIVVVGTVNDHDLLPAELISRFANKYFFDIPDKEAIAKIIEVKSNKFGYTKLSEEDKSKIAVETNGFVGREFDDLFSKIHEQVGKISDYMTSIGESPKKELQATIDLCLEQINLIKPTIQSLTQEKKIEKYRNLKGKYRDPNKLSLLDQELTDTKGKKFDFSKYVQ